MPRRVMKTLTTNAIKQAQGVVAEAINNLKQASNTPTPKVVIKTSKERFMWDFPLTADVTFFDASLSYELSGYRPITKTQGLDFKPEWFTEARDIYLKTGHYTSFRKGTKGFRDYWHEQYRRCKQGYTVNGYTVTGEHYFFLNFYQLPLVSSENKAGSGRNTGFPNFMVSQYQFFHYIDLAKKLHKHVVLMKARGIKNLSHLVEILR